jgi:hypothetical protein
MEAGVGRRNIWFNPPFLWKCLYQVRAIAVFPIFRLLTDFVCLLIYEFCLSLWKIARCSVMLLLPLFLTYDSHGNSACTSVMPCKFNLSLGNYLHRYTFSFGTGVAWCQILPRRGVGAQPSRDHWHFKQGKHICFVLKRIVMVYLIFPLPLTMLELKKMKNETFCCWFIYRGNCLCCFNGSYATGLLVRQISWAYYIRS